MSRDPELQSARRGGGQQQDRVQVPVVQHELDERGLKRVAEAVLHAVVVKYSRVGGSTGERADGEGSHWKGSEGCLHVAPLSRKCMLATGRGFDASGDLRGSVCNSS